MSSHQQTASVLLVIATTWATACDLSTAMATITDRDSPYYDRPCPLEQYRTYKSDLIADCRCGINQVPSAGIPVCRRPYEAKLDGVRIGAGPSLVDLFNLEYNGGFLEEDEGPEGTLYVATSFGGSLDRDGHILKIDVATGIETFSNDVPFEEWGYVGEGPRFGSVLDIARAPDGSIIAFNRDPQFSRVLRVDPFTGDREVLWDQLGRDGAPTTQCFHPTVGDPLQITDTGFAVDEVGRVYLGVANPVTGRGIVRFSPSFDSCEVVTLPGVRGDGIPLSGFINGFSWHEGYLIAAETMSKQWFAVDIETGDRLLIVQGQGVAPAERWARWDADRQVWWLVGYQNAVTVDIFEPDTGNYASIFGGGGTFDWMPLGAGGPVIINSLNYAPFWIRSNGNLLIAQDGMSIVEFEPHSGNSVVISL
jgi:hypothetical protein